jgi:hypothetical protein
VTEQPHTASCSLNVLIAKDTPKGVILRRGPSQWVQLILWHTDIDSFEEGQWFRGRIYAGGCDLSPDGSLFLYVALKERTPFRRQSSYTYKWTAVSRPPYFTALALWPLGDTQYGGGVFLNNKAVLLYRESAHAHPDHQPQGLHISASLEPDRLRKSSRDGWSLIQEGRFSFERKPGYRLGKGITIRPYIWQKYHPGKQYLLVSEASREPDFKTIFLHALIDTISDKRTEIKGATWVDWDQQGRLVFARDGQLFASETPQSPLEVHMIADFCANTPASILSPDWARRW